MIVASVLTPIEDVLTAVLEWLHTAAGLPWAWAVVGLTVIVRMLLVPLMVRQIHSMQRLQRHAPQMKEIQRKYKGDRQRMNEELMQFYKENQINPAASCLPVLFQIPIFFALFFVLRDFNKEILPKYPESDLDWLGVVPSITAAISAHWSGYVLLAVYVVSQVASTFFMSATMDRMQRILFLILPVIFVPFILDPPGKTVFPVGLLMYWMTTNLWTVGQGLVTRRLAPKTPLPSLRRPSRRPRGSEADGGDGAKGAPAAPKPPPAARRVRRVKRKKKRKARR